jgi:hypothetical protein
MNRLAHRGWKRRFDEPIPLPRGRYLVTLEDAGNYITRLAKAGHEAKRMDAKGEGEMTKWTLKIPPVSRGFTTKHFCGTDETILQSLRRFPETSARPASSGFEFVIECFEPSFVWCDS